MTFAHKKYFVDRNAWFVNDICTGGMATQRLRSLWSHSKSFNRRILLTSSAAQHSVTGAPAHQFIPSNSALSTALRGNRVNSQLVTRTLCGEPETVNSDSEEREVTIQLSPSRDMRDCRLASFTGGKPT